MGNIQVGRRWYELKEQEAIKKGNTKQEAKGTKSGKVREREKSAGVEV